MTEKIFNLGNGINSNFVVIHQQEFDKETLDLIFSKGFDHKIDNTLVDGKFAKQDICGAVILRNCYNMNVNTGWVVALRIPESHGGTIDITNLIPIQLENYIARGEDYPICLSAVSVNGAGMSNIPHIQNVEIINYPSFYRVKRSNY